MNVAAPPWLSPLQQEFSTLLRQPLDARSGTFREVRGAYPAQLVAELAVDVASLVNVSGEHVLTATSADRLALYHTQYWMRLFNVLQQAFARVARAIGYFHFNRLASLHLDEHPPVHFDIERAVGSFGSVLSAALALYKLDVADVGIETGDATPRRSELSRAFYQVLRECDADIALVTQALGIDEAEQRAFNAPLVAAWQPTIPELASLEMRRLRFAPGFAVLREDWNLVSLTLLNRAHSSASVELQGDSEVMPVQLKRPRYWALHRSAAGIERQLLSAEFASVLFACQQQSLQAVLVDAEARATPRQLNILRQNVAGWVKLAIQRGWWVGLHE